MIVIIENGDAHMINTMFFMALLMLLAVLIIIPSVKNISKKHGVGFQTIFDREITESIRGISIIMIMFAHIVQQLGEQLVITLPGGALYKRVVFSWGAVGVGIFFLMSGYGNTASLIKLYDQAENEPPRSRLKSTLKWLLRKLMVILIGFVISFVFVVVTLKTFGVLNMDMRGLLFEFVKLKIPECSTWYLKIQCLMYICIAASFHIAASLTVNKNEKNKFEMLYTILLFIMTVVYYGTARYIVKLPDYWWKTILCFWAGAMFCIYKKTMDRLAHNWLATVGCSVVSFLLSYTYVLLAGGYTIFHLVAYVGISLGICLLLNAFCVHNVLFKKIGSISLELYLVHIGCMTLFNWRPPQQAKNYAVIIHILLFAAVSLALGHVAHILGKKTSSLILK